MIKYGETVKAKDEIQLTHPKTGEVYTILSCPVCKSKDLNLHTNFDFVHCNGCGISGPTFDGHPEDAVAEWNSLKRD